MRVWISDTMRVDQIPPSCSTIREETKHPSTKGRGESVKASPLFKTGSLAHMGPGASGSQ